MPDRKQLPMQSHFSQSPFRNDGRHKLVAIAIRMGVGDAKAKISLVNSVLAVGPGEERSFGNGVGDHEIVLSVMIREPSSRAPFRIPESRAGDKHSNGDVAGFNKGEG